MDFYGDVGDALWLGVYHTQSKLGSRRPLQELSSEAGGAIFGLLNCEWFSLKNDEMVPFKHSNHDYPQVN